ncbi:MAG: hypothetical protein PGN13_00190 [Patulibacter minatonensis]
MLSSSATTTHPRLAAPFGAGLVVRAALALLLLLGALLVASADAGAAGTPNLSLSEVLGADVVAGEDVPVRLTASTPAGAVVGHSLSYRAVLPGGSAYVGGSADASAGEPTILSNAPTSGQTTLLWKNVGDLAGGTQHDLRFGVRPSTSTYGVNTMFSLSAEAYVTDDARYVPGFTATGQHDATIAHPSTGSASATATTQMHGIGITETATNQPDGELLRGVHDHQSVITLSVRGTSTGPTNGVTLDHYLPAGLEYLGCGGAGADHTTSAATNPGSAEESPGSGPIVVPAVSGCIPASTVVTGTYDPPGSPPSGIYTRVRWSIGSLTVTPQDFSFAVAIPRGTNTATWTTAAPATTGAQGANLGNNSGPELADGAVLTDATTASGLYVGLIGTSAQSEFARTAHDLSLRKAHDTSVLRQGTSTRWSLTLGTSEYRAVAAATVTDTVPDGLCPVSSAAPLAATPDADDLADCAAGPDPTDPYAAADEQADGTWNVRWDQSTAPFLASLPANASHTISYTTRTRTAYQQGFAADAPVLAGDTVTNAAQVSGGGLADTASSTLTAAPGAADKQVALSGTDCSAAAYSQGIPSYAPGDRVCWLTRVDFPSGLDTSATQVGDYLPAGLTLDPGFNATGEERTGNDDLGASTFDASGATPGPGGAVQWSLPSTYAPGASVFEHRLATRLGLPSGGTDGMLVENTFKASVATSQGTRVALRDTAAVQLRMPVLAITERITAVDGTPVTASASRTVRGGQVLTYRLRVANTGGRDATKLEAWAPLPTGLSCADVVGISLTGACSGGVVRWGATPTVGVTAAVAGTTDLTFDLQVPTTVEVGQSLVIPSGIRRYAADTNDGGSFTYVPASNVDPTQDPAANVPALADAATITGDTPTITESRTTSLTEPGNNLTSATIGETVTYEVSATMPAGLTVRQLSVTDGIDTRHAYIAGSLTQTAGPAVSLGLAGGTITLAPAASYTSPTGADTIFTFTFQARVADTAANTRGGATLANQALLKWTPYGTANGGTQIQRAAPLQSTVIVEPALTLVKVADVGATPVIGGQDVQYTVTLGTSAGAAHETTLVDHVPTGTTPLNTAGDPIGDGESTTGGGVWNASARTLTFAPGATIVAGTPEVYVYSARVNIPVTSGALLTNTVSATTTSLPGIDPAERTPSSPVTTGYVTSASATLNVRTPTVVKTADVSTRNPGERVNYSLTVTIPPNVVLSDVYVRDLVPDAIDVDGYRPVGSFSCTSGCTPGNEPTIRTYTPVTNGDGTVTVAWDLGDLPVQEPVARTIVLEYDGHVRLTHRNGGGNVIRGQQTTDRVQVFSDRTDKVTTFDPAVLPAPAGGFDNTSVLAPVNLVTVVEPGVALDAQLALESGAPSYVQGPVMAHDGDRLNYRLTISNPGNAPLHDVSVQSTPDAGLRNVQLAAGLSTSASTDGFSAGDPRMTWLVPGPIPAGGTAVLEYTADLPTVGTLADGQNVDQVAQVTASYGVAEATRTADGFGYRSYATGTDLTRATYDAPTLTLAKTTTGTGFPESGQAEVGQAFGWRVVVTNTSTTETGTALTIHDTLPPNWTYVSGSATLTGAGGGAQVPTIVPHAAGDDLTFATGLALAPGASRTLTYTARPTLAAATTPGTGATHPHVNTAQADVKNGIGSTADAGGLFRSPSDTAQAILAVPTLAIDTTPDGGAATAGQATSYTVKVTNAGLVGMTNVELTATFPSVAPYAPGSATAAPSTGFSEPSASGSTATWRISSIAAGGSVTVTVPLAVPASLASGTALVLDVSGTSDQTTGAITDAGDRTVARSADLAASLSATPNPATAGSPLTYTLGITNHGPSNAADAEASLVLPSTVTFAGAPAGCTYTAGTRTVRCAWTGDLAPAAALSAQVATTVNASAAGNADATVAVDGAGADPVLPNDTAGVTVPIGSSADLRLTHTVGSATIARGAAVTFTLTLHNDGPSDAAAAQITDTLPAGLAYVSDDAGCSVAGQVLTCGPATLVQGGARTVHVVARGTSTGAQTASAVASTTTADPTSSNDAADATATVLPVADLQLALGAPATLPAGGTMTVGVDLTNAGPDPATAVQATVDLPAGTTFSGADPGCTLAARRVTCAITGGLASGAVVHRDVRITAPTALADQHLTTTGTGTASEVDADGATDAATTVIGPSADLSVETGGAAEAVAGGTAELTVTAHNAGPSAATNVEVTAELPAGVGLSSVVPPSGASCAVSGQVITCQVPHLPANARATFTITVAVPAELAGQRFTMLASARSAVPDPNGANASAGRDTPVVAPPVPTPAPAPAATPAPGDASTPAPGPAPASTPVAGVATAPVPQTQVKISQRASTKQLRGGSTVTYALTVRNTGKHVATGLRVCSTLPQFMAFRSVGSGFMSGAQLCFRTKTLAPGRSLTEKVQARVSKRAKKGSVLMSRATVEVENAKTASVSVQGRVVTDGRVKAESVKGFTG